MRRLIITIIIAVLITSLSGCVAYSGRHHSHGRQVVVVAPPKHPPVPPAPPRAPRPSRGRPAPPPMPTRDHHR